MSSGGQNRAVRSRLQARSVKLRFPRRPPLRWRTSSCLCTAVQQRAANRVAPCFPRAVITGCHSKAVGEPTSRTLSVSKPRLDTFGSVGKNPWDSAVQPSVPEEFVTKLRDWGDLKKVFTDRAIARQLERAESGDSAALGALREFGLQLVPKDKRSAISDRYYKQAKALLAEGRAAEAAAAVDSALAGC